MRFRDFLIFAGVCLIWAANLVVSRALFSMYAIAPIFYAAARFAMVAVILSPLLRPLPKPLLPVIVIGALMGAFHFGLMFLALNAASTTSVSIVLQLSIPLTAILSVLILGEQVGWRRSAGIALAFTGVMIVMWEPSGQSITFGLIFAFASAASLALGSILLKRYGPIRPLRLQAWVALASFPPLTAYSLLAEHHQIETSLAAGWPFWAGLVFSAFVVTIIAHTLYFGVLQRYPASLIAPLGLMMPLMSIAMGVVILHETFDLRMLAGGVVALAGLLVILSRQPLARAIEQPSEAT
ncbi:MAG: hypothetical protein JWQ65_471 [Devosia sp.]|nr:hypothetical protein [Devosia sp.]